MTDSQNTLGDLLGKLGLSMGDSESRRQDMIRRLKTVKDPEERDRLIWALSGQKREAFGYRPSPAAFDRQTKLQKRPVPADASQGPPAMSPGSPAEPSAPPQLRIANIFNYIIPILFIFFGISNITRAIEAFREGAEKEEVLVQLIIGVGFIIFAVTGLLSKKIKKAVEKTKGI